MVIIFACVLEEDVHKEKYLFRLENNNIKFYTSNIMLLRSFMYVPCYVYRLGYCRIRYVK
jgi:hypothetical protein